MDEAQGRFLGFPELQPRYGIDPGGQVNAWPEEERYKSIQHWCEAAFEEAESDQKGCEELQQVEKYIDYLAGKQWSGGRPSYRSKPVNNRMYRLFWEVVGLLTDIRPIVDIRSTERSADFIKQEETLNQTTRAWWINSGAETRFAMSIVYAMLSTGFCKLEWQPNLQFGMGDMALVPLGPTSVLPIKPGMDLQDSEGLIYNDVKAVGWVRRKYPLRAHLVRPDIDISQYQVESGPPSHIAPQLYQRLTPAFKRIMKRDNLPGISAYPMCRYREFWIKDYTVNTSGKTVLMGDPHGAFNVAYWVQPGQMLYPRGRLMVMAGREIVHDGPNPYWHGMFPFSIIRLNVVPWQIWGMSDLRSLKDLQDIVNQILSGVLDMIKRAINPPFFAPKTAFGEATWQSLDLSMPGARMAFNAVSPYEPKVINTTPLPAFVLQMETMVEREMDQHSNIAAVNEAVRKKQIPGGDTLDNIRNAQQTPLRLKGRNIEAGVRDLGMQLVPNFFQFYSSDRRVYANDASGKTMVDVQWKAKEMMADRYAVQEQMRKFRFSIVEGSLLSAQRMEMLSYLIGLRRAGDLDRRTFYDRIDKLLNVKFNVDEIEQNLMKEHQMGLAAMPPKKGGGGSKKSAGAGVM